MCVRARSGNVSTNFVVGIWNEELLPYKIVCDQNQVQNQKPKPRSNFGIGIRDAAFFAVTETFFSTFFKSSHVFLLLGGSF